MSALKMLFNTEGCLLTPSCTLLPCTQNLQVATELQVAEALLRLPGATVCSDSPKTPAAGSEPSSRSALPLWRALRVGTLHRAELFSLQCRVAVLADHRVRT